MARMRSIREAAKMIKEVDHNTCISEGVLRRMVEAGTIPHVPIGKKKVVNVDAIFELFNMPAGVSESENETNNDNKTDPTIAEAV